MTNQNSYNLTDYVNAFRRRLPLFIYVAAPILLVSLSLAIGLPDIYRSSVEMKVNLEGPEVANVETVTLASFADQYVNDLQRDVLSRKNRLNWIRELNVYPEMVEEGATDSELASLMSGDIRISRVTTGVLDSRSGRELELIEGFEVAFDHRDPTIAQKVASKLAAAFLQADIAIASEKIDPVLEFLNAQMQDKLAEIAALESQLADFKEANRGKTPDMLALNMAAMDRDQRDLETTRQNIRKLQQDLAYRRVKINEIGDSATPSGELDRLEQEYVRLLAKYGPDHPDLIRIKRQIDATSNADLGGSSESAEIAQLQTELAALRQRYSDEHPDVVRLSRQIDALRQDQRDTIDQLRDRRGTDPRYLELEAQINAIDTELQGARGRESELRSRIRAAEEKIAATPQVEREYLAMQRDLDSTRDTYRNLQREYEEAKRAGIVAKTAFGARLKQLGQPWVPDRPASPPRLAIVILGLFLGMSLAGMTAIAAEALDSTVRGSSDIYNLLQAKPIVVVPVVQNTAYRVARRKRLILVSGSIVALVAVVLSSSGLFRLGDLL